jgi:hypothetical protein
MLAFALGAVLLLVAIVVLARQQATIRAAIESIASFPPAQRARLIATVLGSVLLNVALTGAMFSLLMSRYGRVGVLEMQGVIASATLMNYLPLRPGILGRVAYHKSVNQIALRDSAKVIVQAATLSAACAMFLALIVLLCRQRHLSPWLVACAPLPVLLVAGALWRGGARMLVWAAAVRLLDVLVTAARYHAAFALIGSPIDFTASIGFACIHVIAFMVPLISNGLGLREWAIGLLAPAIASYQMELGITADLLNRAAEVVIVTLTGVPATLWLAHRARRRGVRAD